MIDRSEISMLITHRMTYYSAHTKYALVYKGVKYDSVTAEYV